MTLSTGSGVAGKMMYVLTQAGAAVAINNRTAPNLFFMGRPRRTIAANLPRCGRNSDTLLRCCPVGAEKTSGLSVNGHYGAL